MVIQPIEFSLKDGRKALIRSPRTEDVPEMLDYLRATAGETEFLMRLPEECGKYTPEKEAELLERVNASPLEAMPICVVDGKIAGVCNIAANDRFRTKHRAGVAIAIRKEYWGLGIGSRMFQELIRIAEENESILQLELEFIEGNARARALYEKNGFRIVGVKPNAIRANDGSLKNEYMMVREMKR